MPLPPNLARSLNGRRTIDLKDSISEVSSSINALRNRNEYIILPRRHTTDRGRGNPTHLRTRSSFIPASSPGFQPVGQRTPYNYIGNQGLASLQIPQSGFDNTLASGQSLMTDVNETGSYPQMPTTSLATPSIIFSPYEHVPCSPSALHSLRGQPLPMILGNSNQYGPSIVHRDDSTRGQVPPNSPCFWPMLIVECDLAVMVRIDGALPSSSIFNDTLLEIPQERRVHPYWPPGRHTTTEEGWNASGGDFTQLTLRSRASAEYGEGQDVPLPFTIVDRGQSRDRNGGIKVDLVLGQDYLERLFNLQNTMGVHRQMEGLQIPNRSYPAWQMTGRSQNTTTSSENAVFRPGYQTVSDFTSPEWQSDSNQIQGLGPSPSWTMVSSQGGSSGPVAASSTTGPDGPF